MSIRKQTAGKFGLAAALLVSSSWLVFAQGAPAPAAPAGAEADDPMVPEDDATHIANLTGANGTGTAWFVADDQNNTLRWTIDFEGVNVTGGNIACPPLAGGGAGMAAAPPAAPGAPAGAGAGGAGGAGGAAGAPGLAPDPMATAAIPALTGAIMLAPTPGGGAGGAAGGAGGAGAAGGAGDAAGGAAGGGNMAAVPGGAAGAPAPGGPAGGVGAGAAGGAGGAAGGAAGGGNMAAVPGGAPGAPAAGGAAGGVGAGAGGGAGGAAGGAAAGGAPTQLAAANEVLDLFAGATPAVDMDAPIEGELANIEAPIFQQINTGACFVVLTTAMAGGGGG